MTQPECQNRTRNEPVMGSGGCGSALDEYREMEGGLGSGPIIDAMPLSMVPVEYAFPEPTPKVAKRRNMEEMSMRPDWLPEDWRMELRVRTSGASSGLMGSGGCGGSLDQYSLMEGGLGSTPIIDALPLSMVPAEDAFPEPTPKIAKRRNREEMAMRPDWLAEDWRMQLRVRTSGASSGLMGSGGCGGSLDQYSRMEGGLGSTPIIDALPLSMVPAEDAFPEPTPKVAKRRNMEEMAMRSDWLPEDWRIDLRVRTSGASAGHIDRYFFDPSGRKFRSKNEVLHFLETGERLKRNADAADSRNKKSRSSSSIPPGDQDRIEANSPQRT